MKRSRRILVRLERIEAMLLRQEHNRGKESNPQSGVKKSSSNKAPEGDYEEECEYEECGPDHPLYKDEEDKWKALNRKREEYEDYEEWCKEVITYVEWLKEEIG